MITRFKLWWRQFIKKHIIDKCPDDIDHPTIDQLTTGNLNKSVIVNIAFPIVKDVALELAAK